MHREYRERVTYSRIMLISKFKRCFDTCTNPEMTLEPPPCAMTDASQHVLVQAPNAIVDTVTTPASDASGVPATRGSVTKTHFAKETGLAKRDALPTPAPAAEKKHCKKNQVLCYDGINKCGTTYGG